MLDLFFRCLDDGTARNLRLQDASVEVGQENADEENVMPDVRTGQDGSVDVHNVTGDLAAPQDWYGLFNFTDDYTDVLASSQPDALNLQNLEFLYRFL